MKEIPQKVSQTLDNLETRSLHLNQIVAGANNNDFKENSKSYRDGMRELEGHLQDQALWSSNPSSEKLQWFCDLNNNFYATLENSDDAKDIPQESERPGQELLYTAKRYLGYSSIYLEKVLEQNKDRGETAYSVVPQLNIGEIISNRCERLKTTLEASEKELSILENARADVSAPDKESGLLLTMGDLYEYPYPIKQAEIAKILSPIIEARQELAKVLKFESFHSKAKSNLSKLRDYREQLEKEFPNIKIELPKKFCLSHDQLHPLSMKILWKWNNFQTAPEQAYEELRSTHKKIKEILTRLENVLKNHRDLLQRIDPCAGKIKESHKVIKSCIESLRKECQQSCANGDEQSKVDFFAQKWDIQDPDLRNYIEDLYWYKDPGTSGAKSCNYVESALGMFGQIYHPNLLPSVLAGEKAAEACKETCRELEEFTEKVVSLANRLSSNKVTSS